MSQDASTLSKSEKILLFLYEYSKGRAKIRYEDIVAGLFKKYPHDFHLKGYIEYPDSGDLIHKPLYDFKKKGLVNALNKVFSLTDRGVEFAKQLSNNGKGQAGGSEDRLSRSTATEVERIKGLEGFSLFAEGNREGFSDNDFYNYLGVTVRTQKNAFIGRLETLDAAMKELSNRNSNSLSGHIVEYHKFLMERNKAIIDFFTKN